MAFSYSKLYLITIFVITAMVDSVNFSISNADVIGVNFLEETGSYLEMDNYQKVLQDGRTYSTGWLKGLQFGMTERTIKLVKGSLCKYYLGDNLQTLTRKDVGRIVEMLSDELHLPVGIGKVTRLDVATNFKVKHRPVTYFHYMGERKNWTRLVEPSSLNYVGSGKRLKFYDKIAEFVTHKGAELPELYKSSNVLRYEQSHTGRLTKVYNVPEVTMNTLCEPAFYSAMVSKWREDYHSINKINDYTMNLDVITKPKELSKLGVAKIVSEFGGVEKFTEHIKHLQAIGQITPKQAFDMRKLIKDATEKNDCLIVNDEAIREINQNVDEVARMCR